MRTDIFVGVVALSLTNQNKTIQSMRTEDW